MLGSSKILESSSLPKPRRRTRVPVARCSQILITSGPGASFLSHRWTDEDYRRTMKHRIGDCRTQPEDPSAFVPWSNEDNYVKIVVSDGCFRRWACKVGCRRSTWHRGPSTPMRIAAVMRSFMSFFMQRPMAHRSPGPREACHHHRNIEADFRHNFVRRNDLSYSDWLSGLGGKKVGTYEVSSIMHYGSGYFAKDFWGCVGPDDRGGDLSLCSLLTRDGTFIPTKRELTGNDVRIINTIYPERTAENDEIEALRRRCKLTVRKFCRTADDVVSCLIDARQEAKAQPGEPFGDNACRAQLKRLDPSG